MVPLAALKGCALFKGFTDTGLQIIAGVAGMRTFPQGTPLFVENMVADSLLIVADGKVRLSTKNGKGAEVSVGEVGVGDALGELSLIQPGQRMCTATALGVVTAVEVRHADFQKLLVQKPQACVKLLMAIVAQFGQKVMENRETFRSLLDREAAKH
ncbi:MAG TPA: cyclic nucleotide-binding domain-containing protein [Myxococcaceae bacterium]|nr:cyclic nucleotide-binding domain-containing protein [Myxococcaceae bacterium]